MVRKDKKQSTESIEQEASMERDPFGFAQWSVLSFNEEVIKLKEQLSIVS